MVGNSYVLLSSVNTKYSECRKKKREATFSMSLGYAENFSGLNF